MITDIQGMLTALAQIGRTDDAGITRLAFTNEDRKARTLVQTWMQEKGLRVHVDPAGNIIGRMGPEGMPAVALGSHIDSVPNGGMFDGPLGVVTALAIVGELQREIEEFKTPVEVIVFADEEGARFGAGLFGSSAMTGVLPQNILQRRDRNGITVAEAIEGFGLDPKIVDKARRNKGEFKAYIELHVEQGRVLEDEGLPVGIVTAIAGPSHFRVKLDGRADHAGATPMHMRHDALLGAAEAALTAERIARENASTTVATVGELEVYPGAANVIPGSITMTFDVRDIELAQRDRAISNINKELREIAEKRGLEINTEGLQSTPPVTLSEQLIEVCENTALEHQIRAHKMVSGAAHDAQNMASLTDVVMIFVRSKNGLSHCPEEYSSWEDIDEAARLLYHVVKKLIS